MTFESWSAEVNRWAFGNNPPEFLPRHVFALYISGYVSGLAPERFCSFLSAHSLSKKILQSSGNELVSLSKANKFLEAVESNLSESEAIPLVFGSFEVAHDYQHLFKE